MIALSCMPTCDKACTFQDTCDAQLCNIKGFDTSGVRLSDSPLSVLQEKIRDVAYCACPRYGDDVKKDPCSLDIKMLRICFSRQGEEPPSWLVSFADWAVAKQETLSVELRSNHNKADVQRISSLGSEISNTTESRQIWRWKSDGSSTLPVYANSEISISVHHSSSTTLNGASPWALMGELKIRLEHDVICNLCTYVLSANAFETPCVKFPLTNDARPVGSIEMSFRLSPSAIFAAHPFVENIRTNGVALREFTGHSDAVIGCAIFDSGKQIITVSGDKRGIIWDALSGAKIQELVGHTDWIQDCSVFPDGDKIVTVSFDKTGIVWDAKSGKRLVDLIGHTDWIKGCDVFPDGRKIVTVSFDKRGIIWDAHSGRKLNQLRGHTEWVNACAVFPSGRKIVTASTDRRGIVWNAVSGSILCELAGHTDAVEGCAVFPSCRKILTVSRDRTAIIWNAHSGESLQILSGHDDWVLGCAVFPSSDIEEANDEFTHDTLLQGSLQDTPAKVSAREMVVTVSSDRRGVIWDAGTGARLQTLIGHRNLVHGCAVFPDGSKLATVSGDEKLIIWDVRARMSL